MRSNQLAAHPELLRALPSEQGDHLRTWGDAAPTVEDSSGVRPGLGCWLGCQGLGGQLQQLAGLLRAGRHKAEAGRVCAGRDLLGRAAVLGEGGGSVTHQGGGQLSTAVP
jgi:hypothetical protein